MNGSNNKRGDSAKPRETQLVHPHSTQRVKASMSVDKRPLMCVFSKAVSEGKSKIRAGVFSQADGVKMYTL